MYLPRYHSPGCANLSSCAGVISSVPGKDFFSFRPLVLRSNEKAEMLVETRKTAIYTLTFPTPPYIEEIVVPQLRKSLEAISALLARHEFIVNRAAYCMQNGPMHALV